MKNTRITRIEKAVAKCENERPDRQTATDQFLRNLHRAYGDQSTPTPKMHWKDFEKMVQETIERIFL